MYVIHKKCDCCALLRVNLFAGLPPLFHELLVKLNQEERLILNSGKQVIVPDKVEDIRSPEAQEVW